jgi:chromosomal replication initiator protein
LRHQEITTDVAREALRDKLRISELNAPSDTAELTITGIQHAVAKEWGVTVEGLRSKTRTKALTVPRQIAMYLTRELLGTQLVEIGQAFGGRDHSTVIHSLEKVQTDIAADSVLKQRITTLQKTLKARIPSTSEG